IHAAGFTDNNIVHQLELKQVKQIIENLKETGKGYCPDKFFRRVHNTITLTGTRGSGKTSFLYSLFNEIKTQKDILTLEIVDPTLTEEKGHIFLNIVARIKERIDRNIDSKNIKIGSEKLDKWNKCLNDLAAGLPMLDGINGGLDPSDWNDTTFVMRDGLRRVAGANNLESYFHEYVKQSLDLLNKDYLFIAFDDVDTDFAKGWPVLETLRKYLTSPQIITFLSGDLDLYSFLVRKKQWKNFGKTLLKNEYDKDDIYVNEYPELVEKLESQYMLKLLKPEYRVTLSTLASKLASNEIKIYLKEDKTENKLSQKYSFYVENAWGIKGDNMKNVYIKFLTSLPLRSQLSLLNTFSAIDSIQEEFQSPNNQRHQITKGISDVFYSELRTANVDIWEMINGYGLINIYLLKFLLDNKILDEASQFFPKLNNPSLDGAVVAIGAVLSERISSSPFEMFDHIIRVSNIVSKANTWTLKAKNTLPNIENFVAHSRSLFDYGLRKTASLQSSYIVSFEYIPQNEGLIPIKTLQERDKTGRDENDLRLDEIFEKSHILYNHIGTLPAIGIQDIKGANNTFYSFFNILAAIGDIIQQDDVKNMKDEFVRMAQFRTFPLYFNTNQRFSVEERSGYGEDISTVLSDEQNNEIMSFVQKIDTWKKSWKDDIIPPYLLGRIM
ncbi:Flp pilus assembly complex ATPase component TadA, partial [Bacteroidales bacterium OttesenSCG-928-E04]|nr:Flp pilus assembly complex ATPase component TadA [Bacteroidales bacterium OttesenSCG-928-E04]